MIKFILKTRATREIIQSLIPLEIAKKQCTFKL